MSRPTAIGWRERYQASGIAGRAESFRFSTDPLLVGKVTDVVSLYLAPP